MHNSRSYVDFEECIFVGVKKILTGLSHPETSTNVFLILFCHEGQINQANVSEIIKFRYDMEIILTKLWQRRKINECVLEIEYFDFRLMLEA